MKHKDKSNSTHLRKAIQAPVKSSVSHTTEFSPNNIYISNEIIKEAAMLREHLTVGSFNMNELINFLERVESCNNSPPTGRKKRRNRFHEQLEKLNRKSTRPY